jgi:uncharacterized repeat protein (TIGR02543 family)
MGNKIIKVMVILALMLCILYGLVSPVMAAGTESIHIVKYDSDGTTILDEMTVAYMDMEAALPVQGDGVTHQYLQGPVFEGDKWDPGETVNIKDWGANKGTDLMDLCELVGGMSPGDTVEVKAADSLSRTYDYPNVYTPDPRQGKMVISWWCDGQYVPPWGDGMRLVFFAETTNPDGLFVFGNWDQHECLAQNRWYFYNGEYPTTTGHSVKYVNQINIYRNQTTDHNPDITNLTIAVSGSGTTTPSAGVYPYPQGTVVNISATPAGGCQFVGWTGDVEDSDSATTTTTMNEDKTVTASFTQININQNYILNISVSGNGTTTPKIGVHFYAPGITLHIAAKPASGWQFVNWTGNIADSGSANTTLFVDSDKTITANFARIYLLTMSVSGNGTTTPPADIYTYTQDTTVNITATPASGWQFVNWTGAVADTASSTTKVTMDGDKTITASFTRIIQSYNVTMSVSGNGTTTPPDGIHAYAQDTIVNITASPASGWQFVRWTGAVSNPASSTTNVTVEGDKAVTAIFTQITQNYDLTVAVSGNGTTTPAAGIHSYAQDTTVNITATPSNGWQFANWIGSVAEQGSANTTITLDGDKTITAKFTQNVQNEMVSSGNPDKISQIEKSPQGIPWYITLAIVGGIAVVVISLVAIIRRNR